MAAKQRARDSGFPSGPASDDKDQGGRKLSFVDRVLTCRDCGREFVFTAGEQEFYQSRGLMHEPRRCPECRTARRASDGARPVREMHDVICSNCGKPTQVPFVPTGMRPVYCMDCFQTARR
jgi:CxxC-x17-CxxC domain-containing protein